ncbi:short chain dehydrogenase [Streptomyces sp. NPDC046909]|uniref:short chain dehydrogenase n=1 Tax=Streptomyces sp. NPDC046909 TaxID=3155617 RepID=UPI0033FB9FE6
MNILLIGTGTLGAGLYKEFSARGHEIRTVGRRSGDLRYDVTDPAQVTALYEHSGHIDAVVIAAGDLPFRPFSEITPEDYQAAFRGKVLSQIDLVRQGVSRISDRGSFTLIAGALSHDPVPMGSAASMANAALEGFARAAAVEIAPQRINAVSPAVLTESLPSYGPYFPGVDAVDLADVIRAYVRSVEGSQTGQVFAL